METSQTYLRAELTGMEEAERSLRLDHGYLGDNLRLARLQAQIRHLRAAAGLPDPYEQYLRDFPRTDVRD